MRSATAFSERSPAAWSGHSARWTPSRASAGTSSWCSRLGSRATRMLSNSAPGSQPCCPGNRRVRVSGSPPASASPSPSGDAGVRRSCSTRPIRRCTRRRRRVARAAHCSTRTSPGGPTSMPRRRRRSRSPSTSNGSCRTSNRSSTWAPGPWPDSRRLPASSNGTARSCRPPRSSRWPRRAGWCSPWAPRCSNGRANRRACGRPGRPTTRWPLR